MSILVSGEIHSLQKKLKSVTPIPEVFWREMGMNLYSETIKRPFSIMQ
jgi:hypothetical protein